MVEEGRRSLGTAETYRRQLRKLSRAGARSGPAGRGTTPLVDKVICAMGRTCARDGQELSQRHLRTDQPDLPDLVFFMLATGARIGKSWRPSGRPATSIPPLCESPARWSGSGA